MPEDSRTLGTDTERHSSHTADVRRHHVYSRRCVLESESGFRRCMMTRFILAFLLLAGTVDAGPKHWIATHKRFLLMEGAAIGAASIHAYGLHHCRQSGIENCQAKYGAAWASFGIVTGLNLVVMPSVAESCWKNEGGKFCNAFAYGSSAAQFGFGINQLKKEKR